MPERQIILVASVTVAATALLGAYFWLRRKQKYYPVGVVTQLNIYPIKSCREVRVEESECTSLGMTYGLMADRQWVLIKSDGKFMPLKEIPKMILVQPSYHGDELHLDTEGMDTLKIPMLPNVNNNNTRDCEVWGYKMSGVDCGEDAGNWFSQFLEKPGLRLLRYIPGTKAKSLNSMPGLEIYGKSTDAAVFADACAYLLMSEESHDEVNNKLSADEQIPLMNFRPNIIISGSKPFDEDLWSAVKIGKNSFRFALTCPRCVSTTVNRSTGTMDQLAGLKSLRKFRLTDDQNYKKYFPGAPLYGVYLQLENYISPIKVGDTVYAAYK